MADKSIVSNSKLAALANAIRTKGGTSAQLTVDEMAQAVADIPTGSSPKLTTGKATPTTEDLTYVAGPGWDGFSSFLVKAIPNEYVVPEGSVSITENGTYDVSDKAEAVVNVPSSGVDITDGIVVKAKDENGYPTEIEYYGDLFRYALGAGRADVDHYLGKIESIAFIPEPSDIPPFAMMYCAYRGNGISSLSLPNVVSVGGSAFRGAKINELSLPNLETILSTSPLVFNGSTLNRLYLPKLTTIQSDNSSNGFCRGCTNMAYAEIGSIGYAVPDNIKYQFRDCTQSTLTICIYTLGSRVDSILTTLRSYATAAAIIFKASEATTYNGTSYAAGDTILTSEVA